MKNLLKKHTTFHIILLSAAMLCSSNILTMESKQNSDLKFNHINVNFKNREYEIHIEDYKNLEKKSVIINSICWFEDAIVSLTFAAIGTISGAILGKYFSNNKNINSFCGTGIGLGLGCYIVVKTDMHNNNYDEKMYNHLERKEKEYWCIKAGLYNN